MPKKDYDKQHRNELDSRSRRVEDIIDEARRKAAAIAIDTGYDGEGDFFFDDYATARKRMETLMKDTASKLTSNITEGITAEWQLSALKMSAIVEYVGKFVKIPKRLVRKWTDPMDDELEDFTERKVTTTSLSSGRPREMTLSERVWNLSGQFKQELELAVEEGMSEGISASELSRKVRKYLNEPEKLFRRVRMRTGTDEDGKPVYSGALRLSKAAQAYHPGTGVYRSSYMNAMRMTVTEINTAYRTADYLRWKSTPFILGIEIRITASRHVPDICDDLKGKYPKDFKFTGWHPWCRCYAVPILPTVEDFAKFDMDAEHHEGEITDVPQNFKNWIGKNEERIEHAKTMPSFLKDNTQYWEGKERKWQKEVNKDTIFNFAQPQRDNVDAESDRTAFRQQQKEVKKALQQVGSIKLENDNLFCGKLLMDKRSREALLGHSFETDELNVIEQMPQIIPKLKNGHRIALDTNNHLYAEKVKEGWQYMVRYDNIVNGTEYELKCAAILKSGVMEERPYSLKKKK